MLDDPNEYLDEYNKFRKYEKRFYFLEIEEEGQRGKREQEIKQMFICEGKDTQEVEEIFEEYRKFIDENRNYKI